MVADRDPKDLDNERNRQPNAEATRDRSRDPSGADVLDRLFDVVRARREERPEGSYVVRLLDGGWAAIEAKLREEAQEVVEAARNEGDEALARESADLIFHLWVLLASRGIEPTSVYEILESRFGTGGLDEKASRASAKGARRKDE